MSQPNNIVIYCRSSNDKEDIGMGHVVRCSHLAKVLRDKGNSVSMITNADGAGYKYARRQGLTVIREELNNVRRFSNTLIVDFQENDDEFLRRVRPVVDKLIVIVGAGKTITERTHWIADLIVYQAPKMRGQKKGIPGEQVLSGLKYIIIDPAYAGAGWQENVRMYDSVVYVGGGVPKGYKDKLLEALDELKIGYVMHGPDRWTDDMMRDLQNSYLFIGTMGMVVYEALACKTIPIVVGRSEDHVRCAKNIGTMTWVIQGQSDEDLPAHIVDNEVTCLGLATAVSPKKLALMAAGVYHKNWLYNKRCVDGLGVYRVAGKILQL